MSCCTSSQNCCCCRIDTAAKIISWIFLVLLLISLALQIYACLNPKTVTLTQQQQQAVNNYYGTAQLQQQQNILTSPIVTVLSFVITLLSLAIYVLVLVGCARRVAAYLLPYLIVYGFSLILSIAGGVYLLITFPSVFIFCSLGIGYLINIWIYSVFYRAYKFIKKEQQSTVVIPIYANATAPNLSSDGGPPRDGCPPPPQQQMVIVMASAPHQSPLQYPA